VGLGIGTSDHQLAQFSHLRRSQFRRRPGWFARHQTVDAGLIISVNPVSQGLTVHSCQSRGIKP
jgi:hypothetical protein